MGENNFVRLSGWSERPSEEMRRRAHDFFALMDRRRSVREFSDRPIPEGVVEDCIRTAGTAPSGAHKQPWHFVAVRDPSLKREIRIAAEKEEREFYGGRAPDDWLTALEPLGTDASKPFLEIAPCLIVIFARRYGEDEAGSREKHYYVQESVGIATGFLIAALHSAGLVTLTHTPSPMGFLNSVLGRPKNERPFLLLVTGYPAENARVPDLVRKPLEEIADLR
ncbi:MAG: nitroreductase family protein [marine benthic group bacterium]|nr:nitroreductase family protein [Gemmatimonadota bacterium]MCL7967561.1 nitroreductase family protein [Gemmatimonadota bacterium]